MYSNCVEGKTALIIGASGLIGREIATKLGSSGARLILHYNKSGDKIKELVKSLKPKTYVDVVKCDFSDVNELSNFINYVKMKYRSIDILVNSAGVYDETPLQVINIDIINKVLNINLVSATLISKEFGNLMYEGSGGIIINLICLTPLRSHKVYKCLNPSLPYILSKAGLIHLTKYLASELAPKVRVVGIAPGWVGIKKLTPNLVKCVEDSVPLERVAEPAEIADLVLYLICSGVYVNGTIIEISGGL
ncbi:MAG: SDR family oxidoreductase [Sulfolobales archaeon]